MMDRNTTKTVTFANAFTLDGFDETFPPGSYAVATHEELLGGLSFVAYRRVNCMIDVPMTSDPTGLKRTLTIKPNALDDALVRDEAVSRARHVGTVGRPTPVGARRMTPERQAIHRADDDGMPTAQG